jgi:hypothetical protein
MLGIIHPILDEDFDTSPDSIDLILTSDTLIQAESLWSESTAILNWLQITTLREAGKISKHVEYLPHYASFR